MRIIEEFIALVAEHGWAAVGPVPGPPGMEEYQFRGTRPGRSDFQTMTGTRVPFVVINELFVAMGYLPMEPSTARSAAAVTVRFKPESNALGQMPVAVDLERFLDRDWVRMAVLLRVLGRC